MRLYGWGLVVIVTVIVVGSLAFGIGFGFCSSWGGGWTSFAASGADTVFVENGGGSTVLCANVLGTPTAVGGTFDLDFPLHAIHFGTLLI